MTKIKTIPYPLLEKERATLESLEFEAYLVSGTVFCLFARGLMSNSRTFPS